GNVLEDLIADLVRHVPQLVLAAAHRARQDYLLPGDVIQVVLRLVARTGAGHLSGQDVLHAQQFPVAGEYLVRAGRLAEHVFPGEGGEHAGVAQVVTGNLGDILGQGRTTLPTERNDG